MDSKKKCQAEIDRENGYKICKSCFLKKDLKDFGFDKDNGSNGTYRTNCRTCRRNKHKIPVEPTIIINNGKDCKYCNTCKILMPLENFYTCGNSNKINRTSNCKKCKREYERKLWHKLKKEGRTPIPNREKLNKWKKLYRKNLNINIHEKISKRINESLRGNKRGRRWETIVNYTLDDLKEYIESKFLEGMNWELFKNGAIEIDHILPRELFEYNSENDIQFKICWDLKNLQPLWKNENSIKGDILPDGRRARNLSPQEKLDYLRYLGYDV